MATRKGINIFGTYVVHHNLYAFFTYNMYFESYKIERSNRIVFYVLFKTGQPSNKMF